MANQFPVLMAIQLLRLSRDLIKSLRSMATFSSANYTNLPVADRSTRIFLSRAY